MLGWPHGAIEFSPALGFMFTCKKQGSFWCTGVLFYGSGVCHMEGYEEGSGYGCLNPQSRFRIKV